MRQFTFDSIKELYLALQNNGYEIMPFIQYMNNSESGKKVILRHDVDRYPIRSLKMASLEKQLGITSTYYFRMRKNIFVPSIINKIKDMGHEIGYHYENLADCKGDYDLAIKNFEDNLKLFREIYPVKTIAMHGSPLSKWDNRLLWKKYDYKDYDILNEPYFDVDFNKVFYLTDACRRWGDDIVNLRDIVASNYTYNIQTTQDIIKLLNDNKFPNSIMFNIHPEHWSGSYLEWLITKINRVLRNTAKTIYFSFHRKQ